MKKILYFDTETTGLDAEKNAVIQVAMIAEIDGKTAGTLELKIKPRPTDEIEEEALKVHGMCREMLDTFMDPDEAHKKISQFLGKHVNRFNKNDKFYPAGYNVAFDLEFMSSFFKKAGDKYFGSWQNWRRIDPLPILWMLDSMGKVSLPNYKLVTVCDYLKIPLQAHDAMGDVQATRIVINRCKAMLEKVAAC